MKKYVSCFLFLCPVLSLFLYGTAVIGNRREIRVIPEETAVEEETILADPAMNDKSVRAEKETAEEPENTRYYLVSEEGYLIIYDEDQRTVRLITHMPAGEFPLEEQELLMEGIWFDTMAEIFSYLESWTS